MALLIDGYGPVGRLLCARLVASGTAVAVVGPSAYRAALLCRELEGAGAAALPYELDSRDAAALRRLLAEVTAELGRIDCLVDLLPGEAPDYPLANAIRNTLIGAGRPARIVLVTPQEHALETARWVRAASTHQVQVNALAAAAGASTERIAGAALLLLAVDAQGIGGQLIEVDSAAGPC
ncbi:SDR family NAD(P)-dependent oxidoreductase [Streptomyces sp. NPDC050485]|uniref:SDR family NAD(P)-dependent oxidoreductase n=1 Tax=Streptomyces sp. NPDC050485 TaxID=3365617 RepID=UPI0037B922BF